MIVAPTREEKKHPAAAVGPAIRAGVLTKRRRPPRRKGGKSSKRGTSAPSLPPSLELVTALDCVRRFTNASAASVAITRLSMAASVLCVCTVANTTVKPICSTYRLVKITIWPATGTSVVWDVNANSGSASEQALNRESVKNSAIPTGITVDQPTVWKPAKGSYLDMWQSASDNGTDQLFAFSGGAGCVFDVHLVGTIGGATSVLPSITTTSTASIGAAGVMSLDTSNKLAPVGYTNFLW